MAETLSFPNYETANVLARTQLTSDIASGVNSLPVENTNDFVAGPVLLGDLGSSESEQVTATTISSATAIPLSANTKLAHNFNEPVYLLFGTQIKIYYAADTAGTGQQPADSSFSLLATVSIDATKAETLYTDNTNAAGGWYKYTYYNGTSETDRSLQDAIQSGQTHYCTLDDIRTAAGFDNTPNITDAMISAKRDAAEKEVNGALLPVYSFPLPQPTNPLIHEVAKQLAAGMLMEEAYTGVSISMVEEGKVKANAARNGGEHMTGLQELVNRDVVLYDATFNETTIDEAHAFGGYPDDTANTYTPGTNQDDDRRQFYINEEY